MPEFTVLSPGPVSGAVQLPGDERLSLELMAFACLAGSELTVENISPAPSVDKFGAFLSDMGCTFERTETSVKLTPPEEIPSETVIDNRAPDTALHIMIPGLIYRAEQVRVVDGAGSRSDITDAVSKILKEFGMLSDNRNVDGSDILFRKPPFAPAGMIKLESHWNFQVAAAAALGAHERFNASYRADVIAAASKPLLLLGLQLDALEHSKGVHAELERRLARATGDKIYEEQSLSWHPVESAVTKIPGDSTLGASLAGLVMMNQRSKLTIEQMLWEQGRRGFFDALKRMKAEIEWDKVRKGPCGDSANVHVKWAEPAGIHVTPEQAVPMSSELLVLGATAASAKGEMVINDVDAFPGTGREAFKLTAHAFERLGVKIGDYSDGLVLKGAIELKGAEVDSGGRADVALALTMAGMSAAGETKVLGFSADEWPVSEFLRLVEEVTS